MADPRNRHRRLKASFSRLDCLVEAQFGRSAAWRRHTRRSPRRLTFSRTPTGVVVYILYSTVQYKAEHKGHCRSADPVRTLDEKLHIRRHGGHYYCMLNISAAARKFRNCGRHEIIVQVLKRDSSSDIHNALLTYPIRGRWMISPTRIS